MRFLDDLIVQLESDAVGVFGVNLFTNSKTSIPLMPSGGASLQVIETGGGPPRNTHNSTLKPAYLEPTAQLTARSSSPTLARNLAEAAYLSLFKVRNQMINSGWYLWIRPMQEPFDDGVDSSKQFKVRFNVTARVSQPRKMS